jgi:hypothetical protein
MGRNLQVKMMGGDIRLTPARDTKQMFPVTALPPTD